MPSFIKIQDPRLGAVPADDIVLAVSTTLYVDKERTDTYVANGSILKPFKTITEAVNALPTVDTQPDHSIVIASGTYIENITIDKPVSIIGSGIGKTTINGTLTISHSTRQVELRHISILGATTISEATKILSCRVDNRVTINGASSIVEAYDLVIDAPDLGGDAALTIDTVSSITFNQCSVQITGATDQAVNITGSTGIIGFYSGSSITGSTSDNLVEVGSLTTEATDAIFETCLVSNSAVSGVAIAFNNDSSSSVLGGNSVLATSLVGDIDIGVNAKVRFDSINYISGETTGETDNIEGIWTDNGSNTVFLNTPSYGVAVGTSTSDDSIMRLQSSLNSVALNIDRTNDPVISTPEDGDLIAEYKSIKLANPHWGDNPGSAGGEMVGPAFTSVDSTTGNVYVASYYSESQYAVNVFTSKGLFLFGFGDHEQTGEGGSFYNPYGVAVDGPNNRVYVSDQAHAAGTGGTGMGVQIFDLNGNYIESLSIGATIRGNVKVIGSTLYIVDTGGDKVDYYDVTGGSSPSSPGTFGSNPTLDVPTDVAVDSSGNFYVVSYSTNAVAKYNSSYVLQSADALDLSGTSGAGPDGIFIDSSDNKYVSHFTDGLVLKYDSADAEVVGSPLVTGIGPGDNQAGWPEGISGDGTYLYIGQRYFNRVVKLEYDGTFVSQWRSHVLDTKPITPHGIARDSNGNIYVSDTKNDRIVKFNSSYEYVREWGRSITTTYASGSGSVLAGGLNEPVGLAIDGSDNLYVVDRDNNRIQKFNADGDFLAESSGEVLELSNPYDVDVDSSGNVFVADSGNSLVQKFNSSLVYVDSWASATSPRAIAVNDATGAAGRVYICSGAQVFVYNKPGAGQPLTPLGTWGDSDASNIDGKLNIPTGIAINATHAFIADAGAKNIQVLSLGGAFATKWGSTNGVDEDFLSLPRNITINTTNDDLYMVDSDNHRIIRVNYDSATTQINWIEDIDSSLGRPADNDFALLSESTAKSKFSGPIHVSSRIGSPSISIESDAFDSSMCGLYIGRPNISDLYNQEFASTGVYSRNPSQMQYSAYVDATGNGHRSDASILTTESYGFMRGDIYSENTRIIGIQLELNPAITSEESILKNLISTGISINSQVFVKDGCRVDLARCLFGNAFITPEYGPAASGDGTTTSGAAPAGGTCDELRGIQLQYGTYHLSDSRSMTKQINTTVTDIAGLWLGPFLFGGTDNGGTITRISGINMDKLDNPSTGGNRIETITDHYGIFMQTPSEGTNRCAIWISAGDMSSVTPTHASLYIDTANQGDVYLTGLDTTGTGATRALRIDSNNKVYAV